MANSAYLALSRTSKLYPSLSEPGFDSEQQTVALANYAVPLLWLAMFRPDDLQSQAIAVEGEATNELAPILPRKGIGKRLRESVKLLRPIVGRLESHAEALTEAIASVSPDYRYITIEWLEVAQTDDPALFFERVRQALSFFAGEAVDDPRALFSELCDLQHLPKYTVTQLWELEEGDAEQEQTLAALLGSTHYRTVPWEPAPLAPSPLLLAVQAGNVATVEQLIRDGADPNYQSAPQFDLPLAAAIKARDPALIGLLVEAGADVNHPQALPLWQAAQTQEMGIVQQLIDAGAKVDYPALRIALESENLPLVKLFVESGIDLNPSHRQVSASDQPLCAARQIDIVRYLIDRGADVNHASKPLRVAAMQGDLPKLQCLIEHGANPNVRDRNGSSPLACAAGCGHRDCVEYLLTLSPATQDIQTAIAEAQLAGHGEIVALLRERCS